MRLQMEPRIESALAILVPEADGLVQAFRAKYDPSAAIGLPAHVTLLYPFKSPHEITGAVSTLLQNLFSHTPSLILSFSETRRFPSVLYLAPVPEAPVRALVEAIAAQFPENRPYGGGFAEVIPHLTVLQFADEQQLDAIAAEFSEFARDRLPIRARVTEVVLLDNKQEAWKVRSKFRLADAGQQ